MSSATPNINTSNILFSRSFPKLIYSFIHYIFIIQQPYAKFNDRVRKNSVNRVWVELLFCSYGITSSSLFVTFSSFHLKKMSLSSSNSNSAACHMTPLAQDARMGIYPRPDFSFSFPWLQWLVQALAQSQSTGPNPVLPPRFYTWMWGEKASFPMMSIKLWWCNLELFIAKPHTTFFPDTWRKFSAVRK